MTKQKSKFKGIFKGVALGFAFVMCSAFFPIKAITSAALNMQGNNIKVNSIKVNGNGSDLVVKKGSTVTIPEGEYISPSTSTPHKIGTPSGTITKSEVHVYYKATNDEVTKKDDTFVADRVGRYTITYLVVDDGMEYTYDLTVKCEVSEAVFDFPTNSENIIPSVYDTRLADNKNIILPLPDVKDGDEVAIDDKAYFTLDKNGDDLTASDLDEKGYVYISLAGATGLTIKGDRDTGFYIDGNELAELEKGQEVKVFYSYYQKNEGTPVFVSSTSKTFTIRDGYYFTNSNKDASGYELETVWSTSVSDITAVVGVEKELPKVTATTKSTNSPANEAVEVYYTIKVEKRGANGRYDGTDISDQVIKEGKFKAKEEGTYKFTYTVRDFYGNEMPESRTNFEISNVKDSRSASVYVYDASNDEAYNEEKNSYESALNMLKSQTGNRNIIMYAVGGTDNMVAKDELTLRRTILDNTGVTMFDIREKQYNGYNLIFAPAKSTTADAKANVYEQIVADNYHLRSQILLNEPETLKASGDKTVEEKIKEYLKVNNYLLVTIDGKGLDGNDVVEDFDKDNAEKVAAMINAGYAYIAPSNNNRKTFTDGTYTFVYGASDNINNETTSRYSVVVSNEYVDESVPTLSFTSDLQVTYLATDTIEFNVATATDSTSQDSRLEAITAWRYLGEDRTTEVKTSDSKKLRYYATRVNSSIASKWYGKTNEVVESDGWHYDLSKSSYKINLSDKPRGAKYVEILAYAIDDYGNAGFFNKIIRISDVVDTDMPELFKIVGAPSDEDYTAPQEIPLPTLYFSDANVDYMSAQVTVYKLIKDNGVVVDKTTMQSYNMYTEFNTVQDIFTFKGGSFRASTSGDYQVAMTVSDAGGHSFTTYFNYNVGGGVVYEKPEIENITSQTIDIEAGKAHYLVPPTISITENENFGYIGIDKDDDLKTATYYTTTIISATDDYELTKYYFTGSKKGVFKLQYKVYLMQYSKLANDFSTSNDAATVEDNKLFLSSDGKLMYKFGGEQYYVYIEQEGENYVVKANQDKLGIDDNTALKGNDLDVLRKLVEVYTCVSKIQTINVGGVDMNITLDDNMYSESYADTADKEIDLIKPNNIEYNGKGYQTNNADSTVTITKTSGNTTTTLATLNFEDWGSKIEETNSNFKVDKATGNVKLVLKGNGRYTIKYSIQAMDNNGTNVGDAKTVEYTIKKGDVVGPELELGKNIVKTNYKLGDTMSLNMAGITVSDSVTTDKDQLLKSMTVRIKNTTQDESYTTLKNQAEEGSGEYIYTHKLDKAGSYTLTISVEDEAGNKTEQSVSFEVSTEEKKDVDVKEVMGGVLIGLSVAVLAGVVIYFVVSKVKLDKKEKKYKDK